jgi:hypothetical protein
MNTIQEITKANKRRLESEKVAQQIAEDLRRVFKDLQAKQKDIDPEIQAVVNKHFWDLL